MCAWIHANYWYVKGDVAAYCSVDININSVKIYVLIYRTTGVGYINLREFGTYLFVPSCTVLVLKQAIDLARQPSVKVARPGYRCRDFS